MYTSRILSLTSLKRVTKGASGSKTEVEDTIRRMQLFDVVSSHRETPSFIEIAKKHQDAHGVVKSEGTWRDVSFEELERMMRTPKSRLTSSVVQQHGSTNTLPKGFDVMEPSSKFILPTSSARWRPRPSFDVMLPVVIEPNITIKRMSIFRPYITKTFAVEEGADIDTARITYNPVTKHVRSLTYDSESNSYDGGTAYWHRVVLPNITDFGSGDDGGWKESSKKSKYAQKHETRIKQGKR